MLKRQQNHFFCPDCDHSWAVALRSTLKEGDSCPNDACPSNAYTPRGIIHAVCNEFEGMGIAGVGAVAALKAMIVHWKDHLRDGNDPRIISEDIDEVKSLLESMRVMIMKRIKEQAFIDRRPFRLIEDRFTVDFEISFSVSDAESLFDVQREDVVEVVNDRFEQYVNQSEAIFGKLDQRKYYELLSSFIDIVVKYTHKPAPVFLELKR